MHLSNVRLCDDELLRDGKKEEGANYTVIPDDAISCHNLLHFAYLVPSLRLKMIHEIL